MRQKMILLFVSVLWYLCSFYLDVIEKKMGVSNGIRERLEASSLHSPR